MGAGITQHRRANVVRPVDNRDGFTGGQALGNPDIVAGERGRIALAHEGQQAQEMVPAQPDRQMRSIGFCT
ncbi:hypothetical protein D3C84_1249280 [compost metagenome]